MAKVKASRAGKELAVQTIQKRFYQAWALTELASSPSRWIYLLESKPGWLSKTALSVVSGVYDPKLLLKGVRVHEWTHDRVGLTLGSNKVQRWASNQHNISDMTAAAELCLQLYWNRYMSSDSLSFQVESMQWDGSSKNDGQLHFRYGHPQIERDQLLFELAHRGSIDLETSVLVLNSNEVRVGTFHFTLKFTGLLGLPGNTTM
ncbi:MAG: hypothetical protein HRT45_05615 [Bdellovibrionales bacterium]|nr:hypothetical protein [Bdellovibrionales bacterium]